MTLRRFSIIVGCVLGTSWLFIAYAALESNPDLLAFLPVSLVGIAGATIANSSGVGGGVVFVPVFDYLNGIGLVSINASQIVATSFLIQCFGMTTGSLTWLNKMHTAPADVQPTGVSARDFWRIIGVVLLSCLPLLLSTQHGYVPAPSNVLFWFKSLSIGLGVMLLVSVWHNDANKLAKQHLAKFDLAVLLVLGAIGGYATALFSVGVGELVALYLFIRNYPLVTCAATAVIISACTVLFGIVFHLSYTEMPWLLAAFAIPGAILGGYIARSFAYYLGSYRLKILAGSWIVLSSCYLLFIQ